MALTHARVIFYVFYGKDLKVCSNKKKIELPAEFSERTGLSESVLATQESVTPGNRGSVYVRGAELRQESEERENEEERKCTIGKLYLPSEFNERQSRIARQ